MNNREKILRDLEYLNGGITALKILCNADTNSQINKAYHTLMEEWQVTLCNVIGMVKEDYYAENS